MLRSHKRPDRNSQKQNHWILCAHLFITSGAFHGCINFTLLKLSKNCKQTTEVSRRKNQDINDVHLWSKPHASRRLLPALKRLASHPSSCDRSTRLPNFSSKDKVLSVLHMLRMILMSCLSVLGTGKSRPQIQPVQDLVKVLTVWISSWARKANEKHSIFTRQGREAQSSVCPPFPEVP